MGALCYWL